MGKIFDAIDRQIIRPRVMRSEQEGFQKTEEDVLMFYSQGNPVSYERTGKLGESPRTTGVSGGNGNYDYSIYLEHPVYSTGTPGFPVLEEAQHNGAGILGKPNTWEDSVKDIEAAIRRNFS